MFNEKYGLKLGELNNTTGTERVKKKNILPALICFSFEL